MKTIARAYLSNRECSDQEAFYHILTDLIWGESFQLRIFLTEIFLVERVRVLLSEKELSPLADDNPKIFKKSNIDRHVEKLSTV